MKRLQQVFMFQTLDDKAKETIVSAMEEKNFPKGTFVIRQGEEGNDLYVVELGELDCFRSKSAGQKPQHLKTYIPGESFGELALLYNAPRAATVQCKTDSTCWVLDRGTFNVVVKDAQVCMFFFMFGC